MATWEELEAETEEGVTPEPTIAAGLSGKIRPSPVKAKAGAPKGTHAYYAEVLRKYREYKSQYDQNLAALDSARKEMSDRIGYEVLDTDSIFLRQPGMSELMRQVNISAVPLRSFLERNPGLADLADATEMPVKKVNTRGMMHKDISPKLESGSVFDKVNLPRLSESEKKVWAAGEAAKEQPTKTTYEL